MNPKAGLVLQVASSFTSTPLERSLQSSLVQAQVGAGVSFCQYEKMSAYMLGTAVDSPEVLGTIVLLRVEDWLREDLQSVPADGASPVPHQQLHLQLRARVNELAAQIGTLAQRGKQVWFLACPSKGWISERHKLGTLCQTYTNLVVARIQKEPHISILRWPGTAFAEEVEDNRADRLGRIPYTQQAFDRLGEFLGAEIARTAQYRNVCAAPPPSPADGLADYLAGLRVHVQLAPADKNDRAKLDRILRMAADFTLTGEQRDLSEAGFDKLLSSGHCLRIVVSDRLSNYGISGILAYRPTTDALIVDTWSLSCTVLGKQVEYAVFSALTQVASDFRVEKLVFEYTSAERNQPTLKFLRSIAEPLSDKQFVVSLATAEARLRDAAVSPESWTVELEHSAVSSTAR